MANTAKKLSVVKQPKDARLSRAFARTEKVLADLRKGKKVSDVRKYAVATMNLPMIRKYAHTEVGASLGLFTISMFEHIAH